MATMELVLEGFLHSICERNRYKNLLQPEAGSYIKQIKYLAIKLPKLSWRIENGIMWRLSFF